MTSPTFCILPWVHVHITADGASYPCCLADMRSPVTNLHQHPGGIAEVIHHPAMNEMRRRMIAGETCSQCVKCYAIEEAGGRSMRQDSNDRYADHTPTALTHTDTETGETTGFEMRYLDIRFSNICNLACVSCSPTFSSGLWDIHERMGLHMPPAKFMDLKVFDSLLPYLDGVTNVNFAGGEPLIMEDHYRVMEHWLDSGRAGQVCVNYTSNMTRLTYKGRDAVQMWQSFPRVGILASLDAWGPDIARIRRGADWDVIVANYRRIRAEAPHVRITISPTISALNILDLFDMVRRFAEELGHPTAQWHLNLLQHPEHLSVRNMSDVEKDAVRNRYAAFRQWADAEKHWIAWDSYDAILRFMEGPSDPTLMARRERFLRDFTDAADGLGKRR